MNLEMLGAAIKALIEHNPKDRRRLPVKMLVRTGIEHGPQHVGEEKLVDIEGARWHEEQQTWVLFP